MTSLAAFTQTTVSLPLLVFIQLYITILGKHALAHDDDYCYNDHYYYYYWQKFRFHHKVIQNETPYPNNSKLW